MKGVIVGSFTAWVEQTRGLAMVDAIINDVAGQLSTDGAYTLVGDYPTAEFQALVGALAARESRAADDVMQEFGRDSFPALAGLHPEMIEGMDTLTDLLLGIEDVIHTDVRKLYPESRPPLINAYREDDGRIQVTYQSHRDLSALCHGLLEGAVASYGLTCAVEKVHEEHPEGATMARFAIAGGAHG